MDDNLVKIVLAIIGLLAAGFVIRLVIKSNKKTTIMKQTKNIVGGDQAGRDIKK